MKKFIYFVAGALVTLSATAFAATVVFTDQGSFVGSWFEDAAVSMNQKGIITGYEDGSFGPSNNVTRAELTVMLDRYDDYIQGVMNSNASNSTTGNAVTLSQIDDIIDNTLKFADEEYSWYLNFVVLAESDLMELDGPPQYYGSSDWKQWDEQDGVTLQEGYTLYTAYLAESGNPSYLHFQGEVCEGDVCGIDKDQWYGPFYSE
jgi:hypothetical protein